LNIESVLSIAEDLGQLLIFVKHFKLQALLSLLTQYFPFLLLGHGHTFQANGTTLPFSIHIEN